MKVGLTYDLRLEYLAAGYSEDETAEFDRPDTIDAIDDVWQIALEEPLIKAEVPTEGVPIWGQQPAGDSPSSNQVIK